MGAAWKGEEEKLARTCAETGCRVHGLGQVSWGCDPLEKRHLLDFERRPMDWPLFECLRMCWEQVCEWSFLGRGVLRRSRTQQRPKGCDHMAGLHGKLLTMARADIWNTRQCLDWPTCLGTCSFVVDLRSAETVPDHSIHEHCALPGCQFEQTASDWLCGGPLAVRCCR